MCHLQRLFQDLHEKLRKGQPGFHRASYTVRANEFFHIPAGEKVRVPGAMDTVGGGYYHSVLHAQNEWGVSTVVPCQCSVIVAMR